MRCNTLEMGTVRIRMHDVIVKTVTDAQARSKIEEKPCMFGYS